ncbi:MAG TPA: M15 family metallopeptidase, partial [Actinomycetota bacterium]
GSSPQEPALMTRLSRTRSIPLVVVLCLSFLGTVQPGAAATSVLVAGTTQLPPAYLMWRTGGLPARMAPKLERLNGVQHSVVVAGDTLWMTKSVLADGTIVDPPSVPYRIPLEVMSTNVHDMTPFLPRAWRDDVVQTLRDGRAIMGGSSAALRRLGVGDRVVFKGGDRLTIGAIVPDEVTAWSELMVSRDVGKPIGVKHDRFALLDMSGHPSQARLARRIAPSLGPGYPPRVREPGNATFRRQGDSVWPPVLMKEGFGEFSAYPKPHDPGYLRMDPSFARQHLVSRKVPLLGRFTCHELVFPPLIRAMRRLRAQGHADAVRNFAGCYNARMVMRIPTASISHHSWGAAVDINSLSNPYGAQPHQPPALLAVMEANGFTWGGRWTVPDGMHFEYVESAGVG